MVFFFHPKSKYSHVGLPDITFIHLGDNGVIVFVKHLLFVPFLLLMVANSGGQIYGNSGSKSLPGHDDFSGGGYSESCNLRGIGINLYISKDRD